LFLILCSGWLNIAVATSSISLCENFENTISLDSTFGLHTKRSFLGGLGFQRTHQPDATGNGDNSGVVHWVERNAALILQLLLVIGEHMPPNERIHVNENENHNANGPALRSDSSVLVPSSSSSLNQNGVHISYSGLSQNDAYEGLHQSYGSESLLPPAADEDHEADTGPTSVVQLTSSSTEDLLNILHMHSSGEEGSANANTRGLLNEYIDIVIGKNLSAINDHNVDLLSLLLTDVNPTIEIYTSFAVHVSAGILEQVNAIISGILNTPNKALEMSEKEKIESFLDIEVTRFQILASRVLFVAAVDEEGQNRDLVRDVVGSRLSHRIATVFNQIDVKNFDVDVCIYRNHNSLSQAMSSLGLTGPQLQDIFTWSRIVVFITVVFAAVGLTWYSSRKRKRRFSYSPIPNYILIAPGNNQQV
jgi:hypothetical protein